MNSRGREGGRENRGREVVVWQNMYIHDPFKILQSSCLTETTDLELRCGDSSRDAIIFSDEDRPEVG